MFRLPYVPTSDELIDNAFRAGRREAKVARSTGKRRDVRMKQSDFRRVEVASKFIEGNLKGIVKNFPNFESLTPFYQSLLNIKIDKNRYKKSLGAVQWCFDNIEKLDRREMGAIRRDESTGKEFLGRAASFIKRIDKDLKFLIEVKETIRHLPTVEDVPTIVVAGFPNVGKSTFVKNLTGSNIDVKPYPFTTKSILVGHFNVRHVRYQIIDSPGLLERPMEERNKIELQAIAALKHLVGKIFFIIDPTQELEPQFKLFEEILNLFKSEAFVGINKIDIANMNLVELVEKRLSSHKVLRFSANSVEDCKTIFRTIYG